MRGLSLNQPYASLVALGLKTIETRKTRIAYRGPLLICSTKNFDEEAWVAIRNKNAAAIGRIMGHHGVSAGDELPRGQALAIVNLVGCRPLVPEDWARSFFFAPARWAWLLEEHRQITPFPIRGMQGLFPIDEATAARASA